MYAIRTLTTFVLLALAFGAGAQVQELRAVVALDISDPNQAFACSIANNSTAPQAIRSVSFTLTPSNVTFDTFGTWNPAGTVTEAPVIGGNANGQSANSITLTPASPIMPGQTLRCGGADIDSALPTAMNVTVVFADGTTVTQTNVPRTGANPYSLIATLSQTLTPLYPLNLTWVPPTQNVDGTPYTNPDGFKIYWGSTQGTYANSKRITEPLAAMDTLMLPIGSWYVVATAVNSAGIESSYSNVVNGNIQNRAIPPVLDPIVIDPEASGLAWLVFTIRNQILFVEAGTVEPGASCDPQQMVRGILPTDQMPHTLNLVAVEDVTVLPSIPADGELALFAECSVP